MPKKLLVALAASFLASSALAINKCTDKSGKVSFQDAPCANTTTQESVRVIRQGTTSAAAVYGVTVLDLSGTPSEQLVRIEFAMKTLSELSDECRRRLDVHGITAESMPSCNEFTTHYKAWWRPTREAMSGLLKDRDWTSQNRELIDEVTADMRRTGNNAAVISSRLDPKR